MSVVGRGPLLNEVTQTSCLTEKVSYKMLTFIVPGERRSTKGLAVIICSGPGTIYITVLDQTSHTAPANHKSFRK